MNSMAQYSAFSTSERSVGSLGDAATNKRLNVTHNAQTTIIDKKKPRMNLSCGL